jgi:tetratricopeptide (TPR) repeat protein
MSAQTRDRGYNFTEKGRGLFLSWVQLVFQQSGGRSGIPVIRQEHAAESGLSRAALHNALHDPDKRFDDPSRDKMVRLLGPPVEELFVIPEEVLRKSLPSSAIDRTAAIDLIAAMALFEYRPSAPQALRSLSRQDRGDFLYWMERFRPVVDDTLFPDDSPAVRNVVAHFYLSYADQILISDREPKGALQQARWAIDRAVTAAAGTHDQSLRAACLLHCGSILYSLKEFQVANQVLRQASEVIASIADKSTADLLRDRLAVNNASVLIAEGRFQEAAPWAREAVDLGSSIDPAWHACARGTLGRFWLGQGHADEACVELQAAVDALGGSGGSKTSALQKVIYAKELVRAQRLCGDERGADHTRQQSLADCETYGFAIQQRKIRALAVGT